MYKMKGNAINMKIEYIKTNGEDERFAKLCEELDHTLDEIVGTKIQREKFTKFNQRDSIHDVFLVMMDEVAVGCGSYKKYDAITVELKRVYLKKECRGHGIAKELLHILEEDAIQNGYEQIILETGFCLESAVGLYQHVGYEIIPNYGQYADMKESICMKKRLI